jgi:DNA sulfur modification protein DndD
MIIRELQLHDFGAYSGQQIFNLSPVDTENYMRPLILIRGKNGVGKSTVLEAIRLCLHGPLALGQSISRREYEDYLASRIHRALNAAEAPQAAYVGVSFDYVVMGRKRHYEIHRAWRTRTNGVVEQLDILEDSKPIVNMSLDQKEALLRELIPPSVTQVFLFDSEKLHMLAADGTSNNVLREMVRTLLGLDIVSRLQRDLDIYLSRQETSGDLGTQEEYGNALLAAKSLSDQLGKLSSRLQEKEAEVSAKREERHLQEQRISRDGGVFAEDYAKLKSARDQFANEIARQRQEIQDLASGLMPFAICPKMCGLVAKKLEDEAEYQTRKSSGVLTQNLLGMIVDRFHSDGFWEETGINLPSDQRNLLIAKLLEDLNPEPISLSEAPLLLPVSERDREILLEWIQSAGAQVPKSFCRTAMQLRMTEEALGETEAQLARVPAEELLQPLVHKLHLVNDEISHLQGEQLVIEEEIRRLTFELQQSEWKVQNCRQRIVDLSKGQTRIELTGKAQAVLKEFNDILLCRKIEALEKALVERFSELCRKPSFAERIAIDPNTFAITMYRRGRVFSRSELSAGEKQLLATAVLWALRDVSRLPIPVFVDTPVARLDVDHREAMIGSFLPKVSHQTVLLTTDAEMDQETLDLLEPLVSRRYELEYQDETGVTQVKEHRTPETKPENLTLELAP